MKRKLPLRRWLAALGQPRSNKMHVLAVSAIFALLMAGGFFAARDPVGLFGTQREPKAGTGVQAIKGPGVIGQAELAGDDPVLHFNETKVGQVIFSSARYDTCRRVLFDNRSGARLEAGEVFCAQTDAKVIEAETGNRLHSVSKSFQK